MSRRLLHQKTPIFINKPYVHDDTPIFAMGVLFFAWVYGHWRAPDASAARGTLFLLSENNLPNTERSNNYQNQKK